MRYVMGVEGLDRLLSNLRSSGYTVLGPRLTDGVVRLSEVSSVADIARGVVDAQSPGSYRTERSGNEVFSAVNGPLSVKTYLHPAEITLATVSRTGTSYVTEERRPAEKYAFVGLRPCELTAVRVLDRALLVKGFEDPTYARLREGAVFIVVNCGRAGENCFCASMGTGPRAMAGYDIALTELPGRFILDVDEGHELLLEGVGLQPATAEDLREEEELMKSVGARMTKKVNVHDPARTMYERMDSPVWGEVAAKCLGCGNCTMVCPTCFCNTTGDIADLDGGSISKVRLWDSCLSRDFTYGAGGNPRIERKARYRQFVMHKFAYWTDQFGLYGCVGCGRCITWCPVGIDISDTVNRVTGEEETKPPLEVAKHG